MRHLEPGWAVKQTAHVCDDDANSWHAAHTHGRRLSIITTKLPVDAELVATYLQFPIQVCFPRTGQPVDHAQPATHTGTVTDTVVVLIIVMITHLPTRLKTPKTEIRKTAATDK